MQAPSQNGSNSPGLLRGMGLGSATALNMIDMIGVGPFITMPLILGAMGGPQAMLGWVVGALFAVCDGLVWAELGAAMPGSGGSYRYLREIYGPQKMGRLISFLFIWQLSFSAPLSIATGCIGLAGYAAYYWPRLETVYAAHSAVLHIPWAGALQVSWIVTPGTAVAIGACLLAILLLYRRITVIGRLTKALWICVMGTIGWIIFAGLTHFNAAQAFDFPAGAFTLSRSFFLGLGGAMLIATYDYWGYYNVCFLGDEVQDPGRNSASIAAFHCAGGRSISSNECMHPGSGAVARDRARRTEQWRVVHCVCVHAEDLWGVGRARGDGAGDGDGVRLGIFADAGVFARALRGGKRWELFSGIGEGASGAPLSARFAAGAGSGCGSFLLPPVERCDRGSGGDSHPRAILGAGGRPDYSARAAAGDGASLSHVALSPTGPGRDCGISLYLV